MTNTTTARTEARRSSTRKPWTVEGALARTGRTYATDRDESEACQASTPGCAIDHSADDGDCEGW